MGSLGLKQLKPLKHNRFLEHNLKLKLSRDLLHLLLRTYGPSTSQSPITLVSCPPCTATSIWLIYSDPEDLLSLSLKIILSSANTNNLRPFSSAILKAWEKKSQNKKDAPKNTSITYQRTKKTKIV